MKTKKIKLAVAENYFMKSDEYPVKVSEYDIEAYSVEDLEDGDVCVYGYNSEYYKLHSMLYNKVLKVIRKKEKYAELDGLIKFKTNNYAEDDDSIKRYELHKIVYIDKHDIFHTGMEYNGLDIAHHIGAIPTGGDKNNTKAIINYFRGFNGKGKKYRAYIIKEIIKDKYELFNKDGNEYLREQLGGDYISVGRYPIILIKRNGRIFFTELIDLGYGYISKYLNIQSSDEEIMDVFNNKLNWIDIGDIDYIINVVNLDEYKLSKHFIEIHDSVDKTNFKLHNKEKFKANERKYLRINSSEMITLQDVKNVIINEQDRNKILNVIFDTKNKVKNVGDNKVIINDLINDTDISIKMLLLMDIIRKYNKKMDHLYNKLKNSGIGSEYFFDVNNIELLTEDEQSDMQNSLKDRIGKDVDKVNIVYDIDEDRSNTFMQALKDSIKKGDISILFNKHLNFLKCDIDTGDNTVDIACAIGIGFNYGDTDLYIPLVKRMKNVR